MFDLKVCDCGKLVQLLRSWTLFIILFVSKMSSCLYFKTKYKQDDILDEDETMDNAQERDNCNSTFITLMSEHV
jgi:hypothetical protein